MLFSPIKSPPRPVDAKPSAVVAWTIGETLGGETYRLPRHSLVTSRYDPSSPRRYHYALVCSSSHPLSAGAIGPTLAFDSLCNLLSGRRIGASQVTAVVKRKQQPSRDGREYAVAFRARLTWPYFVRLSQPVPLSRPPRSNEIALWLDGREDRRQMDPSNEQATMNPWQVLTKQP